MTVEELAQCIEAANGNNGQIKKCRKRVSGQDSGRAGQPAVPSNLRDRLSLGVKAGTSRHEPPC